MTEAHIIARSKFNEEHMDIVKWPHLNLSIEQEEDLKLLLMFCSLIYSKKAMRCYKKCGSVVVVVVVVVATLRWKFHKCCKLFA